VKTFLRKVKLSFLAMLCGWIACNIAWWVTYGFTNLVPAEVKFDANIVLFESHRLEWAALLAVITGIWIMVAWFAFFLPVDLCVSDGSSLRRPRTAALCGFTITSTILAIVLLCAAAPDLDRLGWTDSFMSVLNRDLLPYAIGTWATGTTAAYVRARMDNQITGILP
jgi:hypothetical protein